MAVSIAALMAAQAAGKALGGVATGAGQIAAARQQFTAEDRKRLAELEELERQGGLGLSEMERERIRGEVASEAGAIKREQESRAIREAAAAPVVTGRDVFLREQVAQQEARQLAEAGRQLETEADVAAEALQRQEMAALEAGRRERRAATAQAVAGMFGGTFEAGAGMAGELAATQLETELEGIRQGAAMTDADLLEAYRRARGGAAAPSPYASRLPRS